jgi:hypothetical protein
MINTRMYQEVIIGATFGSFFNMDSGCCKVMERIDQERKSKKSKKAFTADAGDMRKQYPESVWQGYLEYVIKIEDQLTSPIVSPGLCL